MKRTIHPRVLSSAVAGVLVLAPLGITSAAARTSPAAADGVSCGVIHATNVNGVTHLPSAL